ncbi:MAG: GNAT family N-acetyltransferase [Chloroflexi bacterium]|nr:GNAT family N-acetyltransferase [Chloroflexota bacterium]
MPTPVEVIPVDEEIELCWPAMDDAEGLFALIDANRDYLGRWLPWVDVIRRSEDERQWVERCLMHKVEGSGTPPLIIYRGQVVGTIGTEGRIDPLNRACEVGYWVAEAYQGRGIVTRACRALVEHLIGSLGLNRVVVRAQPDNWRSVAIPQRLGFTYEGIQRQAAYVGGQFHDLAIYAMLAQEWAALHNAAG